MRKNWISLSTSPRLKAGEFGIKTSGDVLGLLKDGTQHVVRLEYDPTDPDDRPTWRMERDRFDVTKAMRAWQHLPRGLDETRIQTRRRIKVLPLDGWMSSGLPQVLEDCLAHGPYKKLRPRFGRPGIYREGASCWFELPDGRAFTYRHEDFDFKMGILNAERITRRQAAALAAVVMHRMASPEQETLLRAYRDMMDIRATGRSARKYVMALRTPPVYDYYHVHSPNGLHLARVNRKSTDAAFQKALGEVWIYTHTPVDRRRAEFLAGSDTTGWEAERTLFERAYAGEDACKTWTLWDFSVDGTATLTRRPLAVA